MLKMHIGDWFFMPSNIRGYLTLLEVFLLGHYGPLGTEEYNSLPTTQTTIIMVPQSCGNYLTSNYQW